jgi:hypothetical protein
MDGSNSQLGRARAALAEFEETLGRTRDDFELNVTNAVPDSFLKPGDPDDERIEGVHESVRHAFRNHDWVMRRAMRQLREAVLR